jgi:hypothetical protein
MTWWRRLLGIEPRLTPLHFAPTGEYSQEIVGEMQAQDTLERLAGAVPLMVRAARWRSPRC